MALMPREIELSIDEIVLEGTGASARLAVADALQAELARLFTEQTPALEAPVRIDSVRAAPVGVTMQAPARALGTAIAASVHAGFLP